MKPVAVILLCILSLTHFGTSMPIMKDVAALQNSTIPVVLMHGLIGDAGKLAVMEAYIKSKIPGVYVR